MQVKSFHSVHITEMLPNLPPHCSLANIPLTPETARDQERRIRREIANSNERRRMQSINAGFQSLKTLIPHSDGEKLSKVTRRSRRAAQWHEINASPHAMFLFCRPGRHPATDGGLHFHVGAGEDAAIAAEQPAEENLTSKPSPDSETVYKPVETSAPNLVLIAMFVSLVLQELSGSSPKRRRAEEKDEGIGSPDILEEEKTEDLRREMIELRQQLEKERSVRMILEDQVGGADEQCRESAARVATALTCAFCHRCALWTHNCTLKN